MAGLRPRGSSVFSGLVLIVIGLLLLLHNYRGFELTGVILRWWPLILIFWGAIKIYERTTGVRASQAGASRITAGEIFLVLGLLALVGIVIGVDHARRHIPGMDDTDIWGGEAFASSIDVAPKPVPANARVAVRGGRGGISVCASDTPGISVAGEGRGKKRGENTGEKVNGAGFGG